MHDTIQPLTRPIRVVLFGGGPGLEPGLQQFLARLEREASIDFVGAFFQSTEPTPGAIAAELWHRRGLFAVPLLAASSASSAVRFLADPKADLALRRELRGLTPRMHHVPDIHAESVLTRVRELQPDLGLIYGSPILKPGLFEIPSLGTLGIHHGTLPRYRGKKTTFWEMYRGEPAAGVTIQKVNAGLDTGQIVADGKVPIGRRARRHVWRDVEALGVDLYVRSVLNYKAGPVELRPFSCKKGKLYRDPKLKHFVKFYWRRLKR
jgi:folate-dependent phosphoribosylglycinamide formyltransferase PurN